MPDDPFADLEAADKKAPTVSGKGDPFADLEAANKPTGPNRLVGGIKAFGANLIPGLTEIPEQIMNLTQFANRRLGGNPLAELTPFTSNKAPYIDALNKIAGAEPQPYSDVTGQIRKSPWFFGQSPDELAKQNPIAATAGNLIGSVPAAMAIPELGLARGLSPLAKLGQAALTGAGYGAGFSGLDEASNQIKLNDQLNPQAIGQAVGTGALVGGGLGLLGGGIGNAMRANQYKNVLAQRAAQQLQREQARMGNAIPASAEQLERLEAGKNVQPAWEQYEPGQLGPQTELDLNKYGPQGYVNPVNPNAGQLEKVQQLEQLSKENEPKLNEFLSSLDKQIGSRSAYRLKKPERIIGKVNRPVTKETKPWFDIEHINDSLGFRTILPNLDKAAEVIKLLGQHFEILKIDNKFANPTRFNYRAINIDVRMPNGQIAEYSLMPPELQKVAHEQHQIYEKWRGVDRNTLSETQKLEREADRIRSRTLGNNAWLSYLARVGKGERAALASLNNSLASLPSTGENRLLSSSSYVEYGNRASSDVQVPSLNRTPINSPSSTITSPALDLSTNNISTPHSSSSTDILSQKGDIEDSVSDIHDSWRIRREEQKRDATPEEHNLLEGFARLAEVRDKISGRLASAIEQIERRLGLESQARKQYIAPDFDDIRLAFLKEHGGVPKGTKGPYVEATLSPDSTHPHEYNFKSTAIRPKMHELKGLITEYREADKNYQAAKTGLPDRLPVNETIQVKIKDDKGIERKVNIRNRVQATGYDWPTPEIEKAYDSLKEELSAASGPYFDRTPEVLQTLLNKAIKDGNQTIEYLRDKGSLDWFKRQSSKNKASLIIGISLAAAMYLSKDQQAEAAPPPTKLLGKVIDKAAKSGWEAWMGSRPITRLTLTEVTSDIIRKGSPTFASTRDAYLAQLRRAHNNPQLAEKLNDKYTQALRAEITKLDKQQIKPGLFGKERYRRALAIDLEDMQGSMTGAREGTIEQLYSKSFGGVIKSQFWGNYRASTMHILEAGVAFASKHPIASADAIHGLSTNPVYRDFAKANSPMGMFQQTLEGQESFEPKIVKEANAWLDERIKALPGGEAIHGTLSAQLPERAKMGFGAVVTAVHNARNYPGGPTQYMRDWLALEAKGTPVPYARQPQFAKAEVDNFVEENRAIMSMPEGPLKERTIFQRHKMLTPLFPYLRAITQQTRFFSGLIDDLLEATANKDGEAAAHAIKALVLGHVMVAMVAGHHVLPDYIWNALNAVDQITTGNTRGVDNLKGLIDVSQKHILGGYQLQDFGIKYFAIVRSPQIGLINIAETDLRDLKPKDRASVLRLAASTLAMTVLNRIGPEGTMNLAYLAERLQRGMQGNQTYRKYDQSVTADILNKIMGRPYATKLVEKHMPFDTWQALIHWLFKIENPAEVEAIKEGEAKSDKLVQKDITQISKSWQKVLAK